MRYGFMIVKEIKKKLIYNLFLNVNKHSPRFWRSSIKEFGFIL